jgi:dimethylhistidine N-methyltransferase
MSSAEIASPDATRAFRDDVRRGLTASAKHLDPRYFYDALGSALFGAICELPEYYVTRAERQILESHAPEIAAACRTPVARLVELGSGSAKKTRLLIDAILGRQESLVYQPIDVDADMLETTRRELTAEYTRLEVRGHRGDFHDVAAVGRVEGRTVVLFLGSSIGNLDHRAAAALLRDIRTILGPDDRVFVGFDLVKSPVILENAYNDALGVTAAFNLNLLARINRELGGTFRLDRFSHRAYFNTVESRIEMHLVSADAQSVRIEALGLDVPFEAGEAIHTENSYKYDDASIAALATAAGLHIEQRWTDAREWFADVLLRPA